MFMPVDRRWFLRATGASLGTLALGRFAAAQTSPTAIITYHLINGTPAEVPIYGPHRTVGAGGDFLSARDAIMSLSTGGPGGVIEFLPGEHLTNLGKMDGRGNIVVTSQAPVRPIVKPRNTTGGKAQLGGFSFQNYTPNYLEISNLEVSDGLQGIGGQNMGGIVLRNLYGHDNDGGPFIRVSRPGAEDDPFDDIDRDMFIELDNVKVRKCGRSPRHNIYINRLDRCLVDGLDTGNSLAHTFKCIARKLEMKNSVLWTADHLTVPELEAIDATSTERWISLDLCDYAGAGQSWIHDNVFHHHMMGPQQQRQKGRSRSCIAVRRRRSVLGADTPPYGSPEFWTASTWAPMLAAGRNDINNLYLFRHVIGRNTFIETSDDQIAHAVAHVGTAPVGDALAMHYDGWAAEPLQYIQEDYPAGSPGVTFYPAGHQWAGLPETFSRSQVDFLRRPSFWFERSRVWLSENTRIADNGGQMQPIKDTATIEEGAGISCIIEPRMMPVHPTFA